MIVTIAYDLEIWMFRRVFTGMFHTFGWSNMFSHASMTAHASNSISNPAFLFAQTGFTRRLS